MRNLLSHFDATPKSVATAIVAIVGILAAYDLVSPKAAVALSTAAVPVCAVLIPKRSKEGDECTTDASVAIAASADPDAKDSGAK